jgi:hypothetical protein
MRTLLNRPKTWGLALLALLLTSIPLLAASPGSTPAALPPPGRHETVWLVLRQKADLSPALAITDWNTRGRFVVDRLQAVARSSQAKLLNELSTRNVKHQPLWIVNAIRVEAEPTMLKELALRPEVERLVPEGVFRIPEPLPSTPPRTGAVEWGIERIRAPEVWSTFGTRGEGIVVGSIDTGAQFDHPALARQYRGRSADGTVDHNYNWFDPSNVCGSPSLVPCDTEGHGTHTMGTMAGDDGDPGPNQIGVAPRVRWMTAKGCESLFCSTTALLNAGQWMLAPTNLSGTSPRPDLRPHIINNSWSGGPSDPFYQHLVQAWVAAGIFPVFSAGNAGPSCGTTGAPASYPESYGVGAFDVNDAIAGFSGRGPSAFGGLTKPDIAAPGVGVRSSVPNDGYVALDGTSMAAPHVSGTVALMWSAAPSLLGQVEDTRALLDTAAVDTEDLSCGGSPVDNSVWGEGRLDAFAAVENSPRGPTGVLTGVVRDAITGALLAGARIEVKGPLARTTFTDEQGRYSLLLSVGAYRVSAHLFGYTSESVEGVLVTEGGTTAQDFLLSPVPRHVVSGVVRGEAGNPIVGAELTLLETPLPPVHTDSQGRYRFESVPEGEYELQVQGGGCFESRRLPLVVDGDETLDITLASRTDAYGYFCRLEAPAYVEATTVLPLSGDDSAVEVALPFLFTYYGRTYDKVYVSTNGLVNFLGPNAYFSNEPIPIPNEPNAAIYAMWDDLYVDEAASVRTLERSTAPRRELVIEWRNVAFLRDTALRVSFEIILSETGQILLQYRDIGETGAEQGDSATVGIEDEAGRVGLQYAFNAPALRDGQAIRYLLPPNGFVQGLVTDANDKRPLAGATVRAFAGDRVVREITTGEDGRYRMQLFLGTYTLEASAPNYVPRKGTVTLTRDGEVVTRDWELRTARAELSPTVLELIVPRGEQRTRRLLLRNTGTAPLEWQLHESGGGQVLLPARRERVRSLAHDPSSFTTRGLYGEEQAGGWPAQVVGDVLRSWPAPGLELPWGVGFADNVWIGDPIQRFNHEFTEEGAATGRRWPTPWAGDWSADMAYDAGRGLMCQVNVGGDNGIYCWSLATGELVETITGGFPWTAISQRGLAYRPDDDTFYVGGWNEGIIYHVKGLSHPDRGEVISQCSPPDGTISGLAWNGSFGILWMATNSPTDTLYELNPDTCTVLGTLAHPNPGFNGAGLELNGAGNLWTVSQSARQAYLVESGVPAFTNVPWLSERPASGTLAPGQSQEIAVRIDTTGLEPGVYLATLFLRSNSGREQLLPVRISLIVTAYQQGVNSGGPTYVDLSGDKWAEDRRYSRGSWGYLDPTRMVSTRAPIAGTQEDPLYQRGRTGFVEYRFDGLAPGVYQLELRFAELQGQRRTHRVYDVVAETALLLPAHDIAGEVGGLTADDHTFLLTVTDGQLNVRFIPRQGFGQPLINALRATHRPDR